MPVRGTVEGQFTGVLLLTQKTLSLLKEFMAKRCTGVETAEQDCREEVIRAHLGPEIPRFPVVHHLLDFYDCFYRRRLGLSFRQVKGHRVKQVIIERNERALMESFMHDTDYTAEALVVPWVGNRRIGVRNACSALKDCFEGDAMRSDGFFDDGEDLSLGCLEGVEDFLKSIEMF